MRIGISIGVSHRGRSGASPPGDIAITWRAGADGGVVAEDVDSSLPVEIADISSSGASAITIFADPDAKFDIVDNGDGTAVLSIDAAIAYATATSHAFTIEASNSSGSAFYAGELQLYEVVSSTAPSTITLATTAIAAGQIIPDDADASLPLLIGTATADGTHPITMTESADAENKFTVTDNGNGTASLYLNGSIDAATDTSHSVTIGASNDFGSTTQAFTFTIANSTNDSGVDEGDGIVITDPNFSETVIARNLSGSLRLAGRNSAEAKFLFDLGVPQANTSYTVKYDPDFTALSLEGKKAFVGFGLKETTGNTAGYHFVGLKGDGATGLNKIRISGSTFKNSGYTSAGTAAASHGTQAGPNWARMVTSSDGSTYKFYTSADGLDWTEEFTGITPTPMSAVTDAAQFGIAALFETDDKGAFSIQISVWINESVSSVPVNTTAPVISNDGDTLSDTNADAWTGSPTSYARQWLRGGVAISGETGTTYTKVSADLGATITLEKTATNAAGDSDPATSNGIFVSAWTPANLSSLVAWYDPSEQSEADAANVSTLVDQSGNGWNASSGGASAPVMDADGINSAYRGIYFDNIGQKRFNLPSGIMGSATEGSYFAVVNRVNDPASSNALGGGIMFNSGDTLGSHWPFTDGIIYDNFGTTARKSFNPTPSVAGNHLYSAHSAASDWRAYLDATQVYSTATNTVSFAQASKWIGYSFWSGNNYNFYGRIGDVILCDSVLTTADRQKVEGYLAHKYGLTANLPSDHPYKANAPIA